MKSSKLLLTALLGLGFSGAALAQITVPGTNGVPGAPGTGVNAPSVGVPGQPGTPGTAPVGTAPGTIYAPGTTSPAATGGTLRGTTPAGTTPGMATPGTTAPRSIRRAGVGAGTNTGAAAPVRP